MDPPQLQLRLLLLPWVAKGEVFLLPRVYLLPRGEAGLAWGVAASLGFRRLADCRLAQSGDSLGMGGS